MTSKHLPIIIIIILFFGLSISNLTLASQFPGAYLGELTWPQAEKKLATTPIVIIPFGAGAKEHGLHLPMNTDQMVMQYLLDKAIEKHDVIITPPILHGWFPAFRDFPGSEVSDPNVFSQYVFQVAESMARQGAKRILFLNTGISKATGLPISIAAREIRAQTGITTLVVSWDDLETAAITPYIQQKSGGHADEVETSIYLFLNPQKVDMSLAQKDYRKGIKKISAGYQPGKFSRDKNNFSFSKTGASGDASIATPQKGEKILSIMTQRWLDILTEFSTVQTSE